MEFTNIFNTKLVTNDNKKNWVKFVVPEPRSCSCFIITVFVEAFVEKIIRQFASLWQAVASTENFEIDSSIADVSSEVY